MSWVQGFSSVLLMCFQVLTSCLMDEILPQYFNIICFPKDATCWEVHWFLLRRHAHTAWCCHPCGPQLGVCSSVYNLNIYSLVYRAKICFKTLCQWVLFKTASGFFGYLRASSSLVSALSNVCLVSLLMIYYSFFSVDRMEPKHVHLWDIEPILCW